ncbi:MULTISPECIES: terminase small subunit [unclassified Bradyrhizobium]|uniref:terminase small subunit n=1 Tax=unclassified Bradyrhizobium TaxID=2631580 RepID=UPI0028E91ABB|nr:MULTISPECIES: terminase small subunit [unclassified Bradyrhizobium]
MPELPNRKRENFCNELLRNHMNAGKAYQAAYGVAERHVADAAGSRLLRNVAVNARINELRRDVVPKTRVTVASLLTELQATVDAARAAKQFGAVNGSLTLIGKLTGLLRDQIEVGGVGEFDACQTPEDVIECMEADCGGPAELVEQLEFMLDIARRRAADRALSVG